MKCKGKAEKVAVECWFHIGLIRQKRKNSDSKKERGVSLQVVADIPQWRTRLELLHKLRDFVSVVEMQSMQNMPYVMVVGPKRGRGGSCLLKKKIQVQNKVRVYSSHSVQELKTRCIIETHYYLRRIDAVTCNRILMFAFMCILECRIQSRFIV